MKRIITLFLAMSVMLAGCSSSSTTNSSSDSSSSSSSSSTSSTETPEEVLEDVELTFWYTANEADENDREHTWLSGVIESFEAEYPHISIKTTIIGGSGGDDYRTKLSAEIASGNAPDVFMMWTWDELIPFAEAGKLMDLTDIIAEDEQLSEVINPANLVGVTHNDRVYALPDAVDLQGLFYNKEIFATYNLELPETTDDLIEIANTLNAEGITPVGLGNSVTWVSMVPFSTLLADIGGEDFISEIADNNHSDFTQSEYFDAMTEFVRLVDADVFTKNFNGIQPAETLASFKAGESAMFLQGTWQISGLYAEMGDNVGFVPFPTLSGDTVISKAIPKGYGASAETEHADETLLFLKYLFNQESQVAYTNAGAIITTQNIDTSSADINSLTEEVLSYLNAEVTDDSINSVFNQDIFTDASTGTEMQKVVQSCTSGSDIASSFAGLQTFLESMQ